MEVPFISKSYGDSASCEKELVYADRLRIPMLPILIQSGYDPNSWVGLIITRWKYLDFTNRVRLKTIQSSLNHLVKKKNPRPPEEIQLQVRCDFIGLTENNELSVSKGEMVILKHAEQNWFLVQNRGGECGRIPKEYARDVTTNSKWSDDDFYFEDNAINELYECMEHASSGTFLVAKVSNSEYPFPTECILLVTTDQLIWGADGTKTLILSIEIKRVANQLETELEPGRRFDSIRDLINYLSQR